ncbi:MAG TPA: tetratricopeptide repeat protein [Acidimicrobiales bacterium]|nr:tetratricopeptide repeat protein [Acidimicrobiales bacterium]
MGTGDAAGERLHERRARLLDALQGGDIDAVDAELEALVAGADASASASVQPALWRGMRALLEGRFEECRRANQAATERVAGDGARAELACAVQAFHLQVARGRPAEAEVLLRGVLDDAPGGTAADVGLRASLAWLLGLLGRDGAARAELSGLARDRFAAVTDDVAALALLAELVTVLDQRADAAALYHLLLPHRGRVVVQADGAVCHGSAARYVGLLAQVLGRWDDALGHFEAALAENRRLGAPLLVAHTCRQWSALLRAGGDDRHWDQAIDLLSEAERIYRRLGVDTLAAEASSVLARSTETDGDGAAGPNLFRREGDGWVVRYRRSTARLGPARGLADLACLLAHPGRSIHVADLLAGRTPADAALAALGRAGQAPPWRAAGPDGLRARRRLDPETAGEYRARLARLEDELARAVADGDRVTAALLRAERDILTADLCAVDEDGAPTDPVDRARRAVATRIRLALDALDAGHPALARHLRHSVRVGTFCSYEPTVRTTWSV